MKKGFALVVVVSLSMLISGLAILLFQTTNLDVMIAGNKRRQYQAATAAQRGMNHFSALRYEYNDLKNLAGGGNEVLLIRDNTMSDKHSYQVVIKFCCGQHGAPLEEGSYYVQSTGWYKKNTKHEAIVVYQSFYSLDNNRN